ncbi:protein bride of sevenless isoform X2 [Atheta coriaria]|uniref:protein bride of sevenless isoform X2 n=1 Tax=Dalotia coriaria TaxID=877792 RepID=UPI0031F470B6
MTNKTILFFLLGVTLICAVNTSVIYETLGSIHIGLILTQCTENLTAVQKTALHSTIWATQRVNDLKFANLNDFQVGLTVHQVCTEDDYLSAIFELYKNGLERGELLLGVMADYRDEVPRVVPEFADILKVDFYESVMYKQEIIKTVVKILEVLAWSDDIEVIAPDQNVLKEFYRITRREWMCVNRFHLHETFVYDSEENASVIHPIVFLGSAAEISKSLSKLQNATNNSETNFSTQKILLVPLDSEEITPTKENYHILQSTLAEPEEPLIPPKIIPSTILFEMAEPILRMIQTLSQNSTLECQNSTNIKCLHKLSSNGDTESETKILSQVEILNLLKLESLSSEFNYILNNNQGELMKYSLFENDITVMDATKDYQLKRNISISECFQHFDQCLLECENFKSFDVTPIFTSNVFLNAVRLRPEPWVYAFFSLSLLGILFCLAIMGFIISRLCKKQVLEGNPILTILLLIDVIIMFASVLPFSLEGNKFNRFEIYILRAICVTIPYTFAFALLLARTILLATVSSEVGFMSHVAGTVQGFLTLFIFAVQCALSLQLSNSCEDSPLHHTNNNYSLLSLMSYNVVLLILLVFITPLIAKSKRNYREGKHFTIAIIMSACAWSGWLPAYAVLDEAWKDPLLCLGLVSTGSILLGSIFIPRTYMMTVSAARERFTSALPSLATATSAMDIYRASTQFTIASTWQP